MRWPFRKRTLVREEYERFPSGEVVYRRYDAQGRLLHARYLTPEEVAKVPASRLTSRA